MKKYLFVFISFLIFIICAKLYAESESPAPKADQAPIYIRDGNKIVPLEISTENKKMAQDLCEKLKLMDANLLRKGTAPAERTLQETPALTFENHILNPDAHHARYTDAEAITAVQDAVDLSFKSMSQINPNGGNIKFFEKTKDTGRNASVFIYGKGWKESEEPKYGKINVDDATGDFSITNSKDEEISVDASKDLKLNPNANGNVVLFADSMGADKNLFIYGGTKSYSSLGFIPNTDDFQIANSKDGGSILLVTKNGAVLAEGKLMSGNSVFVNCKGQDKDSYIYFYENGKANGAFIKYSRDLQSFEFSSPFADLAEKLYIDESCEAGDVIVFNDSSKLTKSKNANSKNVIGVISGRPAFIIGGRLDGKPIALAGQIKVKVCGQNGEIKNGDFLTTSDTPGYAMKSTELAPGSVLGQAMENFSGKQGEIKMVVKMR